MPLLLFYFFQIEISFPLKEFALDFILFSFSSPSIEI
jgi:hypothetical protein